MSPLRDPLPTLRELVLNFNNLDNLSTVKVLVTSFPFVNTISFQANAIKTISNPVDATPNLQQTFPTIKSLNLTQNRIAGWAFLDDLCRTFPAVESLRINGNPLFNEERNHLLAPKPSDAILEKASFYERATAETQFILTLARIRSLKTLNYSAVTPQDRLNGELYYLAQIEKEIGAGDRNEVLGRHRRYFEICAKYDRDPKADLDNKKKMQDLRPGSLASRLLNIHLYQQPLPDTEAAEVGVYVIPRTIDVYRLKGLISRELHLPPLGFRLIYQSEPINEQAEVGRPDVRDDDSDLDRDPNDAYETSANNSSRTRSATSRRHEIELVSSTQDLSFFVENDVRDVRIRIEAL